jgi:allantoin racemase
MAEAGRAVAAPGTELVTATARRGLPYISNRAVAQIGGAIALDLSFSEIVSDQRGNGDVLLDLAVKVVRDSGADCLIFGGAPLAGFALRARDRIPVPIVDPVAAAVKQAETLVALAPRKSSVGSFARPSPKATLHLAAALAARIEHQDVGT